ncbi:gliding motility-associated C-terminal domain-containing protein [Chitinophaga sp.]|uniref:gliding motility-associated C-terminal domain-containing protein n=1 Tax=Chitinophaga sp. TaxID=1869181 RepID=UPI002616A1E7|nr:gliding motility-associated C-terminal domain-containing protein [uncultured Chitinophaga sp.]
MVPMFNRFRTHHIFLIFFLVAVSFSAAAKPRLTNFTWNTTCINDSVTFFITDDTAGIDSVKWYFVSPPLRPEDSSNRITGAWYRYSLPGTYTVTLKAYRNGVEDITTQAITIVPRQHIDLGPQNITICENTDLPLTAPDIPGATYTWYYLEDTVIGTHTFTATEMATYHVAINGCREIDSVNLFTSPIPDLDLGPDRTLCTGELLTLDATAQNATYVWSTGETSPTIVASGAGGTYSVVATVEGCGDYTDQVTINFTGAPYPFSLGNDTLLCPGETVTLDATSTGATGYLWNTGSINSRINVRNNGTYSVFVNINNICSVVDTIEVRYSRLRDFSLGNDTTLCQGGFVVLSADHGTGLYRWQDGSDQATYYVDSTGYYSVRVQIGRCVETDTIRVVFQDSVRVYLGEDTVMCTGETLMLRPMNAGMDYKWQDSSSVNVFPVTQRGWYAVVAENVCNRSVDSILVSFTPCDCEMYFPTGFSPNGDGYNDYFRPKYRCNIGNYKLSIYNRVGNFIFHTSDPQVAWTGQYNGKPASIGTYVWMVEYVDLSNLKYYRKTGTITLLR